MTTKMASKKSQAVSEAGKVIQSARVHYSNMQKSWWNFANAIYEIYVSKVFLEAGFATFKDFCLQEYPSANYTTVVKFLKIVENIGPQIESKIKKDKDYHIPAYEACYILTTLRDDRIEKEEITKLKKATLESSISLLALQERLKTLVKTKAANRTREEEVVLERELESDIKGSGIDADDEEEFDDFVDVAEEIEEDEEDADTLDLSGLCRSFTGRANYITDNLDGLFAMIKKEGEISDDAAEVADLLVAMVKKTEGFLNKLERMSK